MPSNPAGAAHETLDIETGARTEQAGGHDLTDYLVPLYCVLFFPAYFMA